MKDTFSKLSERYAKFRPSYPREIFDFLLTLVPGRSTAWDCGTGNGQVAVQLAGYFERVFATDISRNQIKLAIQKPNILYSVAPAESTSFADASLDLITVAQAVHWFDFPEFYREADRTLRPNGILAIIGYPAPVFTPAIDELIIEYRTKIVGPFWDPERRYVDEHYRTIPFPYPDLPTPDFSADFEWDQEQVLGYLSTWSAAQHYFERMGSDPLDPIRDRLRERWGSSRTQDVSFPMLLRVGRKPG